VVIIGRILLSRANFVISGRTLLSPDTSSLIGVGVVVVVVVVVEEESVFAGDVSEIL
jgi:hypothetical protein